MVGCDRRMMTISFRDDKYSAMSGYEPDLLRHKLRCTSLVLPLPKEQFAQERVQRLLLISKFLTPAGI
jgi:hypothetical protein